MMLRKTVLVMGLTAVLATPASACDLEDLMKELRSICTEFVTQASAAAGHVNDRLTAEERAEVARLTREALAHCEGNTFLPAAQAAAHLGVMIGRLEAKYGVASGRP